MVIVIMVVTVLVFVFGIRFILAVYAKFDRWLQRWSDRP